MRMTRQRKLILDELCKAKSHPTADEVYKLVRPRMPRISLGTVYRNLDQLSASGQIVKLTMGGGPMRFDSTFPQHHHIRCSKCGKVDDIISGPNIKIGQEMVNESGYELVGYKIEFHGLCPRCRKRNGNKEGKPQSSARN
jgi:Fur family transcriptional regulator, ferric uptake regulator